MEGESVAALATAVITALGALAMWVKMVGSLAAMNTKIDTLTLQVEKHNRVVERTYRLEERMDTIYRLHDELKADVDSYHKHATD